jgi:uncharacterized protein GlcG (DUF336 family)
VSGVTRAQAEAGHLVLRAHEFGAVGVSGAVPADHDHAIADAAAGHPTVPRSH